MDASGSPIPPGATAAPPRGGTLSITNQSSPATLDPAVAWELNEISVVHAVYQGLFRYAAQPGPAGTQLEPCLAEALPTTANKGIADGGRTITVRLREGVRFQPPVDREITAEDVVYSIERMLDPRTSTEPPGAPFYAAIKGVGAFRQRQVRHIDGLRALDTRTLRIELDAPDLSFLNALALDFCDVVAREWVERWGLEFGHHPLGTGPFVFESWRRTHEIVLKRNPTYWEEGRPYLDGVRYVLAYSPATALEQLKSGTVDILGDGVPPDKIETVLADPVWRRLVHSTPQIAVFYLFLNVQMPPFDRKKVRQAISWAIDRDKLARSLAGGATPLYQVYPPGLPGHQPGAPYYGYDPARARRLLAEAGLPNGFATKAYTDNVEPSPTLMESVRGDLGAVGIRVELAALTPTTFSTLQQTPRALTMGSLPWWVDFPDPADWIVPIFSRAGTQNSSFWHDPRLEELLATAQATIDPKARLALFVAMQDLIMEEAPYVTLCTPGFTTMCSPRVGGFLLHAVYVIDPAQLWVTEP